jgi:HAD superfamily hydrolase (TIGR01509 family)
MQAVIFDMDGVIINSEPIHQKTELDALAAHGLKIENKNLSFLSGATRNAFKKGISEKYDFHPDWDLLFEHKDQYFYQLMQDVEPIPGVLSFIEDLQQNGVKLAIATSGQERSMNFVLDKFNLKTAFGATISASDVTKSKPHPQGFLKAASNLSVYPSQCVVIEDSVNGVQAAKAANMYAIAITTTFSLDKLLQANRIIDQFEEINAATIKSL